MLLYWYQFTKNGQRIETQTDDPNIAAHFLHLLLGKPAPESHVRAMDVSLVLYAEHEFNASTFTVRVITSTLADFHSAIVGGIGALRGPLHGGANEAAMDLIDLYQTPDEAEKGLLEKLAKKELIMGFGHRVYKKADPRSAIIQEQSKTLAAAAGDTTIYPVSERIDAVMRREKGMFTNLDFYSASPTASWASRRRCSRRSSSSRASAAGRRTSSSSASATGSSARRPITPGRSCGSLWRLSRRG